MAKPASAPCAATLTASGNNNRGFGHGIGALSIAHSSYINVDNSNVFLGLLLVSSRILNLMNHVEALGRSTEDRMLPIEPGLQGNDKLAHRRSTRIGQEVA